MKIHFFVLNVPAVLLLVACGSAPKITIERLDPRLDELVPAGASVERLAGGFRWTEGPVWIADGGYLLFSDTRTNKVHRWQEGKGVSVFLEPSGYTGSAPPGVEPGSNGLAVDREGCLLLCQHGDRRVARIGKDGVQVPVAIWHAGRKFNSPNDLVVKSNGDIYFTDPPYGLTGRTDAEREIEYLGVYRVTKDGEVALLSKEMSAPNGIAFSPDEKTLYVANSDPEKAVWMAFDVADDGTLAGSRVFFDATPWVKEGLPGLPDGLKVDRAGNLFATGPGGVNIFSPEGKLLGRIRTGVPTANCAWGDDGSTLYITADTALLRVKVKAKGF
jgi:gluconolactonase